MKVTIVGGGFGGVKAALELSNDSRNQITLISDRADFQYYPALYSTATGHSRRQSWVPLGQIFAGISNVKVVLDTVVSIDKAEKTLTAVSGSVYVYETAIFALGSVTTYFGIEGLDVYSYGIKSSDEIKKLKKHLYEQMGTQREMEKHYIIVGAGPTGIELASSLGEYLERLRVHFGLKKQPIRIDLVEASPRVMPRMSEKASAKITARLKDLGINVMTGKKVEKETVDGLMVDGKPIKSHTVIWTSGVANNPFFKANEASFTFSPNGKIIVNEFMQADKHVYVIGDNAFTPNAGLAQTALHDAIYVANNLKRVQNHQSAKPYKSVMPPVVIPVGKNWALFSWHGVVISGWVASQIRRFADLIGYSDVLPIGQALGVLGAERIMEDEYFPVEPAKII